MLYNTKVLLKGGRMNTRKSTKNYLKMTATFLFPFVLFGGGIALSNNKTIAESENVEYVKGYHETVSLTNSNFTQGNKPSHKGDSLSGWNAIETDSRATGMLIDVGSGVNTDEDSDETKTFASNKDTYMLTKNPGSNGPSGDTRILMINSKEKLSQKNIPAYKGYRSSQVTLEANSYYRISVSALAMLNGDDYVNASIYVNGIKDKDGENVELGYENITSSTWKEYFFFIATGSESQKVTLDLYLGSKSAQRSEGAVFFDNANIIRYSENEFFELCESGNFGYQNQDVYGTFDKDTVFLIDGLKDEANIVEGTDSINLDFEDAIVDGTDTLGDYWSLSASDKSNASARVVNIRDMQPVDFKNLTGYGYVGDDLSKDNNQALVLWTDSNETSSSFVGVKSTDIAIKAHNVYKVTLKMKSAGIEKGSFYLKVSESDMIYDLYPTLLSSDSNEKNYYQLGSSKTSGITSNVDNNWTNDYQTIEFYVKGHSVYNSFVNLEMWLGQTNESAKGCVVIDNISIEYASYSDFSNASNKLELKSFSGTPSNISNPYFNNAEISDDATYPLTATDWTVSKGEEDYNESGVVYIGSQEEYDSMYKGKYSWAGIRPAQANDSAMANNVYMMYNSKNTFQSITSKAYSLDKSNAYYKLSFDYLTQDLIESLNSSKIKVEVIDENGIILFSKNNVSTALGSNNWETMDVYFHLPTNVSHSVQVKVSLGTEDDKVGGLVYLDNFDISFSDDVAYANGTYKSDLTDYYFNLSSNDSIGSEVTDCPGYKLSVDEVYAPGYTTDTAGTIGGIVSGQNNIYGVVSDNNILVITNRVASKSTLKSNYKVSLETDKYYLLTFDLQTIFNIEAENAKTDEHDCKYGLSVKIDGYDAIEGLLSRDELKNFKVYYKATSASTPTISFSLVSDCDDTLGTALITNFDFVDTTEEIYNGIKNEVGYNSSVFTAKESDAVEEETPGEDEDSKDTSSENSLNNALLLASSLIMGIALVVAIIGFLLRKIKIKKVEKVKKENYDRKLSKNHDAILTEAQKRRDAEVVSLQNTKASLEEEKVRLEETHKEYIRANRSTNGKLSRDVEKSFKNYNSNINRINEKINIIKEKIDFVMTAEYLLNLQRKVLMEEEEKIAQEKKARKKELKARLNEEE